MPQLADKPDRNAKSAAATPTAQQFAVLPYRHTVGGGMEVLLITSLETHRWVIPKGWPMQDKTGRESAAQEAFEEAGIIGVVGDKSVGDYIYLKVRKRRPDVTCAVTVYPMLVTQMLDDWPEKTLRTLEWVDPAEAAARVAPEPLGELIVEFGKALALAD